MKAFKLVVVACLLSAAAVAEAQAQAPAADSSQQVAQASTAHAGHAAAARRATALKQSDQCVGPASFCNVFFGS
jgi:hypothetical protein